MIRRFTTLLLLAGLCPLFWAAQSIQAQETPATSTPPAATTPANSQTSATTEKPKKVWTNDDLKSVGSVSVVGDSRNQKYTMTKPTASAAVAKYRADLQKLQTQLNDVNKKLQEYQDFSAGKPSDEGGRDLSHGYSRTPVDQQIAKLQDKQKQLKDQIDDLYESARKNGIESGQLK